MDEGGLELTVLYPTTLLGYAAIVDPDYLVAITRAYILRVKLAECDAALSGCCPHAAARRRKSIKELRRAINELGFVGAFVPAVGFGLLGERRLHRSMPKPSAWAV